MQNLYSTFKMKCGGQVGKNLLLLLVVAVISGCQSVYTQSEIKYNSGDYSGAAAVFDESYRTNEAGNVLANLYMGGADFMAGSNEISRDDFFRAEDGMSHQESFWDLSDIYSPHIYDGAMLNTYQAMNFLFMNDEEKARVAFNRLELYQEQAVEYNRKAISKRQEAIQKAKSENLETASCMEAVQNDQQNIRQFDEYSHLLDNWQGYGDFENPAARFLSGVFRMYYGQDASDYEKASFHMKRCWGETQSEPARFGLDLAENLANGHHNLSDKVVVFFENGLGMTKVERRFELVVPFQYTIIYVGMALPELKERNAAYSCLNVLSGGMQLGQTMPLCSMDRIVATEFKEELPGIIARAVLEAVSKVVLQIVAVESAKRSGGRGAALATGLAGSLVSGVTTYADVRNWNYLPKEFQACWLNRPENGHIDIADPGTGKIIASLELPKKPCMVYVKAVSPNLPPLVKVVSP